MKTFGIEIIDELYISLCLLLGFALETIARHAVNFQKHSMECDKFIK